jgi:hypothetical protein
MGIGWLELTIVLLVTVVWFGMLVAIGMGVWALLSGRLFGPKSCPHCGAELRSSAPSPRRPA